MTAGGTLYAPTAQLEAWLANARPGHSAIYAVGAALDRNEPVVKLVNDWIATSEVIPVQRRVDGALRYEVQRITKAADDEATPRRLRLDAEFAETPEGHMLSHLSRLANMNVPCPSNPELAGVLGLRDGEAARYRFNNLVRAGHILVTSDGERRIVTIVKTGKRTAAAVTRARA